MGFDELLAALPMDEARGIWDATSWTTLLATALAVAVIAVGVDYLNMLKQRQTLPPGPFPLPLWGNTLSLPPRQPWVWFDQLAKEYGDAEIITIWCGRRPQLWLCDPWAADELLSKRANIYSSRPRMVVFGELGSSVHNVLTLPYGNRWRELRKVTHSGVGMQQVKSYRDLQNDESKQIPWDILNDPEKFTTHMDRYATSVVSIIGFGRRLQNDQDPILSQIVVRMQQAGERNVPGKSWPMLIETFPILSYGRKFVPWLKGFRHMPNAMLFFYKLAEEAAQVNPNNNYCKELFSEWVDEMKLSKLEVAGLAGNLFGAGSDTSAATLATFTLACVAFPDAMKKAWEEIDAVVGHDRSPHFDDMPDLPYVSAFVSEVFRWRSVAIIGGQPHAPIQDDSYKNWIIPANTWVQANLWSIHRRERDFPDPDTFNPNRYMAGHPDKRPYPDRKGYNTFGYGRRVCAGQALAEQGTWISVARMLWAFNITNALDEAGNPIPVDIFNYTGGLNMRPEDFPARFIPRSDKIRAAIEREAKEALENLEKYNQPSFFK